MTTKEEFDASCNDEPSVSVSREPVDDYEISQHSADEVIYPTAEGLGGWTQESMRGLKVSEPEDIPIPICWRIGDECVINQDRYIIRNIKEVYTVDSIGNKWSFDANYDEMQRPGKSEAELEAEERDNAIANAVHSLPKEEMASIEWGAHAERIIESLYDSGRLTKES